MCPDYFVKNFKHFSHIAVLRFGKILERYTLRLGKRDKNSREWEAFPAQGIRVLTPLEAGLDECRQGCLTALMNIVKYLTLAALAGVALSVSACCGNEAPPPTPPATPPPSLSK